MNDTPFLFTISDQASPKVKPLLSSLNNNLFVLETYCQKLMTLSKIFRTREFLASANNLKEDTVIVFVDGYDVLCIRNDLNSLVADFKATGKDLIVSAETIFCHQRDEALPYFLERYMPFTARYLNSGFIIAYKWAYLRMLDYIVENYAKDPEAFSDNDQGAISNFMLVNSNLGLISMDLDATRKFCHTHTYHDNPLQLETIDSYFVHVTWLALEIQARAYRDIVNHFVPHIDISG